LKRIRAYKSLSPESIIEIVLQAKKGLVIKLYTNTLLEARVAALEQANNAASERKNHKEANPEMWDPIAGRGRGANCSERC
jgi:hypothetical protein